MAKVKKPEEVERKPAKVAVAKEITLGPGERVTVHLVAEGEELARYVAQASEYDADEVARGDAPKRGSVLMYQVPHEDAAPVQDPDPISDHRHMQRAKKEE